MRFTSIGTLPAACTASVWKYTSASAATLPISSTGCSTPVSLLAIMMVMSLVFGRRRSAHIIGIDLAPAVHRNIGDLAA